jgi:CRP-like cAMP-binding protein
MTDADTLKNVRLFAHVEARDLAALAHIAERHSFPANTVLFRQGDAGDALYIILSGHIRIYLEQAQQPDLTLRQYGPGDILGEFALIDQRLRSTSAAAVEPLEALMIRRQPFIGFLREHPVVGLALMRSLTERIRYTTTYLEKVSAWIERMSAGEYEQVAREISASAAGGDDMGILIGAFLDMVHSVQAREQAIKRQDRGAGTN